MATQESSPTPISSELTATGEATVISQGFVAYGESNPSDGYGPRFEIGRYADIDGAIAAARGKGVQGAPGSVSRFRVLLYGGGAMRAENTEIIGHRAVPDGSYAVGFLDQREYEFGVRPASAGPVRPTPSMLSREKFAVGGAEAQAIPVVSTLELWDVLFNEPGIWVALWRRAGEEDGWRGEFAGSTERELERRLAPVRVLTGIADL